MNALRAGPPATVDAVDRRAEVIEAAARLFTERGYHETSMGDIARSVGLAKPTLYHYFPSKQEILWGIFKGISLTFEQLRQELTHLPPRRRIEEMLIALIEFQVKHRVLATAFSELARFLPAQRQEAMKRNYRPFTKAIRAAYEEGATAGDFASTDPALFAQAVLALTSTAYRWIDAAGPLTPREVGATFAGYLMDGIDRSGDAGRQP